MRIYAVFLIILTLAQLTNKIEYQNYNQRNETVDIEVYDAEQMKIIKRMPINDKIRNEIYTILNSISSVVLKVKIDVSTGYIVKVQLTNIHILNNKWINDVISQSFIVQECNEDPFLILITSDGRSNFYYFDHNINFLNMLLDISITCDRVTAVKYH